MNNVKSLNLLNIFIISAPSGAGKTTLVKRLCDDWSFIKPSISFTTRKKRLTEEEGIDYYFVTEREFNKKIEKKEFIEYQNVYGNYYGTSSKLIINDIESGFDVLLEIDYKGMLDIKNKYPNTTSIYILPPNEETLKERLKNRGEDDIEEINSRMKSSKNELNFHKQADYVVINDDFNEAVKQLKFIILEKKLKWISLEKWVNSISSIK